MGSRAIALGPIGQHEGIQRLYESHTHGVAGHSSTNEGSPSCDLQHQKSNMRETLITSIHMSGFHSINALIALSVEAKSQMPHARLPLLVKTCLDKVRAHEQYHKHFCNSSPCNPSPQQTPPRCTMSCSKAKKKERRDCKLTNTTATKKQVGEAVRQTTPTTTTCKEFTYDSMSQYRYQKWASTSNYCFNPLSNMSLLPHEGLCETPYDDEEMLEVVWIGTFGDGVPVKP